MSSEAPIGVFDSGLGGLSIAREIRRLIPAEPILYFADTAWCPYGGRPVEQIRARSLAVGHEITRRGAKALVVACNTASSAALELLREQLPIPVIGTEPAVKPAVHSSRSGRIGVIATTATSRSQRLSALIDSHAGDVEVVVQACPGLADLVEAGQTHGDAVERQLRELLAPLRTAGVDTVVLGCTHYPFVREIIQEVMGPDVELVDSGAAVARQTERVLIERRLLARAGEGEFVLLTSGSEEGVAGAARRLWGEDLRVVPVQETGAPSPQMRSTGAASEAGSSR